MLQLHTLGGVYVSQADGTRVGGAAAQRRSLALLSVLAAHGLSGVSRDRLLSLLWPDGDPDKVRHALTQSLYHIRRALACDDLFVMAGSSLSLNPERIDADVARLLRFEQSGDNQGVADTYRGAFLEGFILPASLEFDQWMTVERSRFHHIASRAIERLASDAEQHGAAAAAADAYKRLVALDPLSGSATMRLMRAMWAAGDRAGAIQQGRIHSALLAEQLEIEPDAGVVRLIAELSAAREAPSGISLASSTVVSSADEQGTEAIQSLEANEPAPSLPDASVVHPRSWWRLGRRTALRASIAGAAALMLTAAAVKTTRSARLADSTASLANASVLVAPFRVAGTDPSLAYLREGMVELLTTRLDDDSAARAIDPGRVIMAWRQARLSGPADTRTPDALRIAKNLGGARVIVGGIVGTATKLVVNASLISVATGETRAQATVEGPVDSLTVLVDRLAARLVASSEGEGDRFTDHFTPSLAALHDFLEGQAAYRGGDYARAIPAYERALARDSGFALAALHLALAADGVNDAEQHDRALALAWANRSDLSPRDAAHLVAFAGPRYPAPSLESEQVAAWERALITAPDRADVWYELGERLFRVGGVAGLLNAHVRAKAVLTRALELEPGHVRARRLLIMLAARSSDTALLARLASPPALRDSVGDLSDFLRWRIALATGDSLTVRRIRRNLQSLDAQSVRLIAMSSLQDAVGLSDGEGAARLALRRAEQDGEWFDALMEQHSFALNEGQPARALEITSQIEARLPGTRAHLRLRVLDGLYGDGNPAAAQLAVDTLASFAEAPLSTDTHVRELQLSDLCVLEQWRLSRGVTSGARRTINLLRTQPLPRQALPITANQRACALILDAMLAATTKSRDATSRVAVLDSLMLSGPAVSDASSYANIVVGRLYRQLGNPRAALIAYRRRSYMTSWLRYLATMRREEADIASRLGETEIARNSYVRYLALRRNPDPALRASVDSVRRAADALGPRLGE